MTDKVIPYQLGGRCERPLQESSDCQCISNLLRWWLVLNFFNGEKMGSNSAYIKPETWQPSTLLTVAFMIQAHALCWINELKILFERKPFIQSSLVSINLFQSTLRIYQHCPSLLYITGVRLQMAEMNITIDLLQT